jgi:hypothetical protein
VLPTMFLREFGDQLGRYATLVDQKHNQFEVLVERNNATVFFTKGWNALRDFYKLKLGAWVTLVFRGGLISVSEIGLVGKCVVPVSILL